MTEQLKGEIELLLKEIETALLSTNTTLRDSDALFQEFDVNGAQLDQINEETTTRVDRLISKNKAASQRLDNTRQLIDYEISKLSKAENRATEQDDDLNGAIENLSNLEDEVAKTRVIVDEIAGIAGLLNLIQEKFAKNVETSRNAAKSNAESMSELAITASRLQDGISKLAEVFKASDNINWTSFETVAADFYRNVDKTKTAYKLKIRYFCNTMKLFGLTNTSFATLDDCFTWIFSKTEDDVFMNVFENVEIKEIIAFNGTTKVHLYNRKGTRFVLCLKEKNAEHQIFTLITFLTTDFIYAANHTLNEEERKSRIRIGYINSRTQNMDLQFIHFYNNTGVNGNYIIETADKAYFKESFQLPTTCSLALAETDGKETSEKIKRDILSQIPHNNNVVQPFTMFYEKDVLDSIEVIHQDADAEAFTVIYSMYLRNMM